MAIITRLRNENKYKGKRVEFGMITIIFKFIQTNFTIMIKHNLEQKGDAKRFKKSLKSCQWGGLWGWVKSELRDSCNGELTTNLSEIKGPPWFWHKNLPT